MTPRKLIEVALPLEEINAACKADKDRKTGTIRNLHKWFAPMPLPAWRALLYAALIDDPADDVQRASHLDLIKALVANGADLPDQRVVATATMRIAEQFPDGVPVVMDPFCGGGSTLVEAQRLGLDTIGSDLNPVPVLIARTLTDLVPSVLREGPSRGVLKRAEGDQIPELVSDPESRAAGLEGLIEDARLMGAEIQDRVAQNLSEFFPSHDGEKPVAWLWARTMVCPNPACGAETVLTTSWWLSKKKGEMAWIEPEVVAGEVSLKVRAGMRAGGPPAAPKEGRGASFKCLVCNQSISDEQVASFGQRTGLGLRMTAIVEETDGGRAYREPRPADEEAARCLGFLDDDLPDLPLGAPNQYTAPPRYGISSQRQFYTLRQSAVLSAFAREVADSPRRMEEAGASPVYAKTVATLLLLALGRLAQTNSSLVSWRQREAAHSKAESAFGRADFPMLWDFAETYFAGGSVGDWQGIVGSVCRGVLFSTPGKGRVARGDAREAALGSPGLVATDPPYFDAIPYADLSDYFYLWHRQAGRDIHPDLYATVAAPKTGELTAFPWHHDGTREGARKYFIDGFTKVFENLKSSIRTDLPLLVVYASKEQQAGSGEETRWSAILTALLNAEFEITATWPIHGTGTTRMRSQKSNAVATYVVMVCRPRSSTAGTATLADFNRALRQDLKPAVLSLQGAGILPVDMAQAAMGPGMQVYSRYRSVLDQSGRQVPVEQALRLINQALAEVLEEQDGELDSFSRFAVVLWERHHWDSAPFGMGDQIARPQGISVDEAVRAGIVSYPRPGYIKLRGLGELDRTWKPATDELPSAWEGVHHLADRLIDGGGISEAGALMAQLGALRDHSQALVYRLHAVAARKGWTDDQERYNALIGSWSDLIAEGARNQNTGEALF